MINHIKIDDFAIIKSLETDFNLGLNVITGETGAGKSVVIEALSLALGGRADKSMVRSGTNKAVITLIMGGEPEIFTREISSVGKSLSKVDGEFVTLSEMQKITSKLVDIHGQYDHQSLLNPENHLSLLDSYGNEYIEATKTDVAKAFCDYRDIKSKLDGVLAQTKVSEREIDFLKFEIEEIESAGLIEGEDEELDNLVKMMQSREKIFEKLSFAYELLSGENEDSQPLIDTAGKINDTLAQLANYSNELSEISETSSDIYFNLQELSSSVRNSIESMDFEQSDLDNSIARLDLIDRLKIKYGNSIEDILKYADDANEKIMSVVNQDELVAKLQKELETTKADFVRYAKTLSQMRQKIAEKLESEITGQLRELNFKDTRFSIEMKYDEDSIHEIGSDNVEFMISANKGQPLQPIAKVASGGELSRLMLAFKAVIGDYDSIETMIFDEIDSGISGITASIVGEKLLSMAGSHQIICITHLPQIAAFADHHYVLEKSTDDETTFTTIKEISGDQRINEIARLLGGKNITDTTLKSASELIELSRTNV